MRTSQTGFSGAMDKFNEKLKTMQAEGTLEKKLESLKKLEAEIKKE